ncbi:Sporulation related domain-containing protein [Mariprofundus ferrinatatus]|uniref:Sporulation related domain-containing protein n=1 Tax=Mariprofundus ferrinatatus TaxID=1921087 RepID=A0A2K8L1J8_9PROT|nr:SPOR domain-containing protein [Mariprofundus ferrinatatus]ATX81178.1 Sporulation related domain-containing protein [Mariprofundus ferrinatatus]
MTRDYAKVQASSRAKGKKESNSALPVLAIIVIAGLCFGAGFWLGGNQLKLPATTDKVSKAELSRVEAELEKRDAEAALLQAKIDELEDQVGQWKSKAGAGAHTKVGELQFYKELPKQSVMPAPVAESAPAPARAMDRSLEVDAPKQVSAEQPVVAANQPVTGGYRIQLGSFKSNSDAMKLQAKLMKGGFSAFVYTVNLAERGQWFRVYAGPYADKEKARDVIRDIEGKMKIRGLLVSDG